MTLSNVSLVGFYGTVENVEDDPLKLGRVKVRVVNHHEELEEDDLVWMTVGSPTTSASIRGIGTSPTWLMKGSIVYGMYFDGLTRQVPIIMGTIPVIPGMDDDNHSVSVFARGEAGPSNETGPDISGSPQYSKNKTIITEAGHTVVVDDTPGSERIIVQHMTGSSVSIIANGDVIVNSVNDSYHLVSGTANTVVQGAASTKAKGITLTSDAAIDITAKQKCTVTSSQQIILKAPNVSIQ